LNKVLVIGAVNIDIFASTDTPYVLEDSNLAKISLGFGGVGGNIATNLNNLDLDVSILTTFSDDLLGTFLKAQYLKLGINTDKALTSSTKNSSVYLGVLDEDNDLFLGLNDMDITKELNTDYIEKNTDYINQFEYIVIDNNLDQETLKYILTTFHNKTLILDAVSAKKVGKLKGLLSYISVLKVNQIELDMLSKEPNLEAQIKDLLDQGLKEILVTNKENPVYYSNKSQTKVFKTLHCDNIVNATGAGDAFISGYVYGLVTNAPLDKRVAIAMKFARDTLTVQTSTIEKGEFNV
jgi:pseudouridine kinase